MLTGAVLPSSADTHLDMAVVRRDLLVFTI